jgi:hypothetical protein
MILRTSFKAVLFSVAIYSVSAFAQGIDPVANYPYISITPASPAPNKDSVNLHLALGSAGNSCMAPTFTGMSFTIQQSPLAIFPPVYTVTLSYTMVPVPPNKMCPMIYMPVDYGPSFALGKLALGTYNVSDQNTRQQVGTFSVASQVQGLKDTVYVTPLKPSVKDSLHFDLFNASLGCCTQYYNKIVSVSDTIITLSFQNLDTSKCACLVAGSHTAFACGPQKAGKYAIYKAQGIYCAPPGPCPLIAGPIQLVRVGEVTVSTTAAVRPALATAELGDGLVLWQSKSAIQMDFTAKQTGHVQMNVFNARGSLVGQLYNGQLSAGLHRFSWTAAVPGTYFLSMEIEGFAAFTRTIVVSK